MNCDDNFMSPRQYCTAESTDHDTCCEYDESDDINRSENQPVDAKTCILNELNHIYEDRLTDIDKRAEGDKHLKYVTCMDWIEMLKRVNKDLLDTMSELEYEACQRISLLERKLKIECTLNYTNEVDKLKNDLSNLLEYIRRAMEDKKWDISGLNFFTITERDILGRFIETAECPNPVSDVRKLNSELTIKKHAVKKLESEQHVLKTELRNKELQIDNYIQKIRELENASMKKSIFKTSLSKPILENSCQVDNTSYNACITELRNLLQEKEMQLAEKLEQNECLQSELRLMKNKNIQKDQAITNLKALAFEVAEKHDQIQQMRSQILSLEEELKKAHKKVQFKDNVIKELRKECKNVSKYSCTSRSVNTSPKKYDNKPCYSSAVEDLEELETIHSFLNLTSRCYDDSDETLTQRTTSLDTVLEIETCRLRAGYEAEAYYMGVLKTELSELFQIICQRDQSFDYQKKRIELKQKKLEELVKQVLMDMYKIHTKLMYVRNHLSAVISSTNSVESDTDSGYLSQEDMEPELSIIKSVRHSLQSLRNENCELREHIHKLQAEKEKYNSTLSEKVSIIERSDEVLRNISSMLSSLCGREISTNCEFELQNPLYEGILCIKNLLTEKEQIIQKLEITVDDLKKELQCMKARKSVLEYETEAKDQTISNLQETIDANTAMIQMIEAAKSELEMQIDETVKKDNDGRYAEILEAKNKLEIECKHQQTTIQNLREALESLKRTGGININNSSVSVPTTTAATINSSRGSLWNWWHSNVHDV